jgi:zinc transporter ZupT
VAVAVPVYAATGSRWRGLQTAVLSGLAEPAAVLLLGLFFPYLSLNKHVVDGMLAGREAGSGQLTAAAVWTLAQTRVLFRA